MFVFLSFQSWKQYRQSRFKKTVAEITMNILIHQIIQKQEAIKGGLISEGIFLSDPEKNMSNHYLIMKFLLDSNLAH
jgi:hypothetical protein